MALSDLNLKVIYPSELAREYVIPDDGLVIGRSADAQFILEDEWISRQHCKVFRENGEIWVEDLGSTNGTFIDGAQISKSVLSVDSNLQLGKIVLKLEKAQAPSTSQMSLGEVHPLTGLQSHQSGRQEIESLFQQHNPCSFYNITLSYAEVAREDFGPDASDFLTYEVGRILSREVLSDEVLVHGNEFQYFLFSPETQVENSNILMKELQSICSKQVFSFEGSPLQGDIDISVSQGNLADADQFMKDSL